MARWIETDDTFVYLVRDESRVDEVIEKDNGVTVDVAEDNGHPKTVAINFEKSSFSSTEEAQIWLSKQSAATADERSYVKTASYVSKDNLGIDYGPMEPTDDQLSKINSFTRSTKGKDDVVVFPTLACNDLIDRDFDQFTPKFLRQVTDLEGDKGIAGKSLMLSHDYSKLPTGRLFDAEMTRKGGMNAVRAWTYVPKTDQYQDFIENIDYGVYWAVSVGVRVGSVHCSICKSPFDWFFNWTCLNGHNKGEYYDPSADESEKGVSPSKSNEEGHKLCYAKMEDPQDFLELSVVFLGAQYSAAFEEKGFLKAASLDIKSRPEFRGAYDLGHLISVKADEVDEVFTPTNPQVSDSGITINVSGAGIKTVDELVEKAVAMNLDEDIESNFDWNKNSNSSSNDTEGSKDVYTEGGVGVSSTKTEGLILNVISMRDQLELAIDGVEKMALSLRSASEGNDAALETLDQLDAEVTALHGVLEVADEFAAVDPEDEEAIAELIEEGKSAPAAEIKQLETDLDTANKELHDAVSKASELSEELNKLQPMADAGEAYIESLKKEAVRLYTLLQAGPGEASGDIETTFVDELVSRLDGDVKLLEHLCADYDKQIQHKFPGEGVRRSSVEDDPDQIPGASEPGSEKDLDTDEDEPTNVRRFSPRSRISSLHN